MPVNNYYGQALTKPEVEKELLGALLRYPAPAEFWSRADEDDFVREEHRLMFRVMLHLATSEEMISYATVHEELIARGYQKLTLERLITFAETVPDPTEERWRSWQQILKAARGRREIVALGGELGTKAEDPGRGVGEIALEGGRKLEATAAAVDLSQLAPSIELLNSLTIWSGRIRFARVKRQAQMMLLETHEGVEILFERAGDLVSFSKARAVIFEATNICLPSPPLRQIKAQWEQAAALIGRLAAANAPIALEPPLKAELRDVVRHLWERAHHPTETTEFPFTQLIRQIREAKRSFTDPVPPAVFVAEEAVWTHVPTLRAWASLPSFFNRFYGQQEVQNGLLLNGFRYQKNVTRAAAGEREVLSLWKGPLEILLPEENEAATIETKDDEWHDR